MKIKILLVTIALLCLGLLAHADSFTIYGSRAAQPATDVIDWGQLGAPGTSVGTPALVSTFDGNPALVGNIGGGDFIAAQEGANWFGGFDFGENLVWTGNSSFGIGGGGPFAIEFAVPVSSFGFSIEADLIAPYDATITVFDTSFNPMIIQPFHEPRAGCGFANSCVMFIGMGDLAGANIGAIEISTDSGDPTFLNDFAIDDVTLGYGSAAPVPEPGSLLLIGTGLVGAAGVLRRKLNL